MHARRATSALASLAMAGAAFATPTPAAVGAVPSMDTAACSGWAAQVRNETVPASSMTLLAEETFPLTGVSGHVRHASYQLPNNLRCDIAWLHVPSAANGQRVTFDGGASLDYTVTSPDGRSYVSPDSGGYSTSRLVARYSTTEAGFWGYPDTAGVANVGTAVYDPNKKAVSSGEGYTEKANGLQWRVLVHAFARQWPTEVPASEAVISTARAVRAAAIAKARAAFDTAERKARAVRRKALAVAGTRAERLAAHQAFDAAIAKATRVRTRRIAAARLAYAEAIEPTMVTYTAATSTPLSGKVPLTP